jgi:hypothetical protein
MAKLISDIFYSKNFSRSVEQPLEFLVRLKKTAASFGSLRIMEDKLFGSMSGKRISTSFEVEKNLDNVTSVIVSISVMGEDENLSIFIKGYSRTVLNENETIFNDFYISEMRKEMNPRARVIVRNISRALEEELKRD